jgi:tripartite-type tricarboxylate transporter receptor subunit TctC
MKRIAIRLPTTSLLAAIAAASALTVAADCNAQPFPAKPVTIQMPTPAGSTFDVILRRMLDSYTARTGRPFVLNPAIGGLGTIAPASLLRAEPDGHTIALTYAAPMTLSPLIMSPAPYDPLRDFAPVSLMTRHGILFVANPKFPASTLAETIALAKAKPRGVSVGFTGSGARVGIILLGSAAGVEFLEVPYKGSDQHQTAAISGSIDSASSTVGLALENIRAGKLKPLFIGSRSRSPLLPNVASISETYPGVEAVSWYALVAPAKTPADRIAWLNREFNAAIRDPKVVDLITNQLAYEIVASTPDELTRVMKAELAINAKVVKEHNIQE